MLFTVVTIIFVGAPYVTPSRFSGSVADNTTTKLPLSFCASIFGMNAKEFSDNPLTLRMEFTYMSRLFIT